MREAPLPDTSTPPRHIAIIMDGNGRWATQRGMKRSQGHRRGMESIRDIVTECARLDDVQYLTLYAMSTENFRSRPRYEVKFLERLLWHFLRRELKLMVDKKVRLSTIGDTDVFPGFVRRKLKVTKRKTADFGRLDLCLALNYGSRDEIARAVRAIAGKVARGEMNPEAIDETVITAHLDTAGRPDPDMLIRTASQLRLSNYLLWQCAYTELVFTDTLWPEFRATQLREAIDEYTGRRRTFGAVPGVK